jgi:hypothetical protein
MDTISLNNEQLFININKLYKNDVLRKNISTYTPNENYYLELSTKIENLNNKILEKRVQYNKYYKNTHPRNQYNYNQYNSYTNNNHSNSNHSNSNKTYASSNINHANTGTNITSTSTSNSDNTLQGLSHNDDLNDIMQAPYNNIDNDGNNYQQYKSYGKNYNKQYKPYYKNYKSSSYNKNYNKNKYKNNQYHPIKDDVYLTINRNLNKLSINNFDAMMGGNLESIGMFIVNEINEYFENYNKFFVKFKGDENMIQNFNFSKLFTKHTNHINFIILVCIKKSLIQLDDYKLYFKYIQTLQNAKVINFKENIIKRITTKVLEIININKETKVLSSDEVENINSKLKSKCDEFKSKIMTEINFSKIIDEFKNSIKAHTIEFLKYKTQENNTNTNINNITTTSSDTMNDNDEIMGYNSLNLISKINMYLTSLNSHCAIDLSKFKYETIYKLFGYFNKYFGHFNSGNNSTFNEYLLSIYENFKNINELLIWEPINSVELENRIYFVIGFLDNNSKFIKCLDYDFFQDIESELETIKKSKNIPVSVKYKLFDTIDNFIQSRYVK